MRRDRGIAYCPFRGRADAGLLPVPEIAAAAMFPFALLRRAESASPPTIDTETMLRRCAVDDADAIGAFGAGLTTENFSDRFAQLHARLTERNLLDWFLDLFREVSKKEVRGQVSQLIALALASKAGLGTQAARQLNYQSAAQGIGEILNWMIAHTTDPRSFQRQLRFGNGDGNFTSNGFSGWTGFPDRGEFDVLRNLRFECEGLKIEPLLVCESAGEAFHLTGTLVRWKARLAACGTGTAPSVLFDHARALRELAARASAPDRAEALASARSVYMETMTGPTMLAAMEEPGCLQQAMEVFRLFAGCDERGQADAEASGETRAESDMLRFLVELSRTLVRNGRPGEVPTFFEHVVNRLEIKDGFSLEPAIDFVRAIDGIASYPLCQPDRTADFPPAYRRRLDAISTCARIQALSCLPPILTTGKPKGAFARILASGGKVATSLFSDSSLATRFIASLTQAGDAQIYAPGPAATGEACRTIMRELLASAYRLDGSVLAGDVLCGMASRMLTNHAAGDGTQAHSAEIVADTFAEAGRRREAAGALAEEARLFGEAAYRKAAEAYAEDGAYKKAASMYLKAAEACIGPNGRSPDPGTAASVRLQRAARYYGHAATCYFEARSVITAAEMLVRSAEIFEQCAANHAASGSWDASARTYALAADRLAAEIAAEARAVEMAEAREAGRWLASTPAEQRRKEREPDAIVATMSRLDQAGILQQRLRLESRVSRHRKLMDQASAMRRRAEAAAS